MILLLLLAPIVISEEISTPSACHNYYEYVCSKNITKSVPKLRDIRKLNISDDVNQYQEYVFATIEPARPLWEVVDYDTVSKWLVQFDTFRDGIHWADHRKRHEDFLSLSPLEKQESLSKLLEPLHFQIFARFYKSLSKSVEYLNELKIPISTHNHFYHGMFDEVRNIHISEIRRYSKYSEDQKKLLIDKVNSVKVIFPYLEYNDVKVWRQAKTEYEREYYRLKTIINETTISTDVVEKVIRIAAVNPTMAIFENYIKEFSPRFIFQHVLAAPSMDSFNYRNEVHASVFTMTDPVKDPKSVYHKFLFVLNHEIQHVHFNVDPPLFDAPEWSEERKCVEEKLEFFGTEWKQTHPDWNADQFSYEDIANVAGLRLLVLYTAERTSDSQQIRNAIESSMTTFCAPKHGSIAHNPHHVSINTAVSQIPTFNSLYNCSAGDRMFVEPAKLCRTLNMDIDGNDYQTQKIEGEDLLVLSQFMDVLENTAVELDAANITSFEGELFEVTVEDVEEKEEELEGSAESDKSSSESSEEDEYAEVENDLDDSVKAEIVSSETACHFDFSWFMTPVIFVTVFFLF